MIWPLSRRSVGPSLQRAVWSETSRLSFAPGTVPPRSTTNRSGDGVPQEAILREVTGENSWESLASAAAFLKERGIYRVLLVSDPFHAARTEAMADELGLEAYSSSTRSSPIRGLDEVPHLAKETVAVAAGQLLGFRRLMRVDAVVERARVPASER